MRGRRYPDALMWRFSCQVLGEDEPNTIHGGAVTLNKV